MAPGTGNPNTQEIIMPALLDSLIQLARAAIAAALDWLAPIGEDE